MANFSLLKLAMKNDTSSPYTIINYSTLEVQLEIVIRYWDFLLTSKFFCFLKLLSFILFVTKNIRKMKVLRNVSNYFNNRFHTSRELVLSYLNWIKKNYFFTVWKKFFSQLPCRSKRWMWRLYNFAKSCSITATNVNFQSVWILCFLYN